MREQFESETDRQAERDFADWVHARYNLFLHKLPKHYEIDFWAERDEVPVAVIEFKSRKFEAGKFATFMLSSHKCIAGYRLANYYGVPFVIVVECIGGLRYWTKYQRGSRVLFRGRSLTQRDDQDVEICEFIPWRQFREMTGNPNDPFNSLIASMKPTPDNK